MNLIEAKERQVRTRLFAEMYDTPAQRKAYKKAQEDCNNAEFERNMINMGDR